MNNCLIIGTDRGVLVCDFAAGKLTPKTHGLAGQAVTSVAAPGSALLAGTPGGIFRSDDRGATWQEANKGLLVPHVRWLAAHPDLPGRVFAGTEPAGLFVSSDAGATWRGCPEVEALRDEYGWSLPYSTEAGCVRGFAFHGARGYAAVEVGGVLCSDDGGRAWRLAGGSSGDPDALVAGFVHPDVHSILVHPSSPDLVVAATGGGLYRSIDGGETWDLNYDCYCRAAWADPLDPAHRVLGPALSVDRGGRIEESRDGGRNWRLASEGLDAPWARHMVERFAQAGDHLLAVLSNGDLFAAPLATLAWRCLRPGAGAVRAVVMAPQS